MNTAQHLYSLCEREALAVWFALCKFGMCLLLLESLHLLTDQQVLKYAFAKKDVHGWQVRRLEFLAEYKFIFQYRSGKENKAVDFLVGIQHSDREEDRMDEGDLDCLAMIQSSFSKVDSEELLRDIARFLSDD